MKRKAAWAVAAFSCIAAFEGLRTVAYRDPVGIPTICFGQTKGVKMGDHATVEECNADLMRGVEEYHAAIARCITVPMSDNRRASVISFAWNVGVGATCSSTFVRKLNAGDPSACDELLRWTRARGVELPGLVKRRQAERDLCLS